MNKLKIFFKLNRRTSILISFSILIFSISIINALLYRSALHTILFHCMFLILSITILFLLIKKTYVVYNCAIDYLDSINEKDFIIESVQKQTVFIRTYDGKSKRVTFNKTDKDEYEVYRIQ